MYIKFTTLILFFLSSLSAEDNMTVLDKYHDNLCYILVDTSNRIDDYFVDDNCSKGSTTHAELINSFAIENYQSMEKDIRLRLRLNLPKIQKNLRLVFEDETSDNSLYDSTKLTNEHLEEKQYFLRLEYFKFVKKSLNMAFSGGLRIRNSHLIPYANIRSSYELYRKKNIESKFYNRLRYYTDGEIENIFEFNTKKSINDSVDFFWTNQLEYTNENELQTLINDITWRKILNKKEEVDIGFGIVSKLKNFKQSNIDYIHIHGLFHHIFYKDWLYYQVAPSILWRETNGFKSSYRYMMNIGLLFKSN